MPFVFRRDEGECYRCTKADQTMHSGTDVWRFSYIHSIKLEGCYTCRSRIVCFPRLLRPLIVGVLSLTSALACVVYVFRGPSRGLDSDGISKDFDDAQTRPIRDNTGADVFAGMSFIVRRHTYTNI